MTWTIVLCVIGGVVLVFFGYLYVSAALDRRRINRRIAARRADEVSRKR